MSQLVVDLETLTPEKAKTFAGMILAIGGVPMDEEIEPAIDPAKTFGPTGTVDLKAPYIEIPAASPAPPPPPPAAQVGVSVTTDNAGLPWDSRIHASTRGKNADGAWKLKRGVEKATVDAVQAELKRAMGIAPAGPQLVPSPAAPPPPPPTAADDRAEYVALIGRASAAQGAGKITIDQINKCLEVVGVSSWPTLGQRLDLVPAAGALIDGIIAGLSA